MAKSGGKRRKDQSCTFCGRTQDMVKRLIAGQDGVCICNDCVQLCASILEQEDLRDPAGYADDLVFEDTEIPSPREIKRAMDEYVIGQNFAKRVLSVAVHNHYKRLSDQNAKSDDGVEIEKSNVLVIGPSGCGKTLMAKILARTVDVPFAIADATTLTEAGYVGEDVENILLRLIQAADGDIARAERGIIFIDEIDKIGKKTQNVSITRDVSGEGVQQALLKMLEGTECNVPPQGGRKHPEQKYLQINTQNILFICGGSFQGLDEVISRRIGHKSIGFHRESGVNPVIRSLGICWSRLIPMICWNSVLFRNFWGVYRFWRQLDRLARIHLSEYLPNRKMRWYGSIKSSFRLKMQSWNLPRKPCICWLKQQLRRRPAPERCGA